MIDPTTWYLTGRRVHARHRVLLGADFHYIDSSEDLSAAPDYRWKATAQQFQGFEPVAFANAERTAVDKVIALIADYQALTKEA